MLKVLKAICFMSSSFARSLKLSLPDHYNIAEAGMATNGSTCRLLRSEAQSNKIALLLRGGSFRDGEHKWCSESTSAVENQYRNTQSHMNYVVHAAKQHGFIVDIFIATYACASPGRNDSLIHNLFAKYGPHVRSSILMDPNGAHQGKNMHAVMGLLAEQVGDFHQPQVVYSHIIIFRLDELLTGPVVTPQLLHQPNILLGTESSTDGFTDDELFIVPWSLVHCWSKVLGDNWCFSEDEEYQGMGHCCCAALARTIGEQHVTPDVQFSMDWHPWEARTRSCYVDECDEMGPWDHREIHMIE